MLINLLIIMVIIVLILGAISALLDIIQGIKIMLYFKKMKGKFLIGRFIENEKREKTKSIHYCVNIKKNGYACTGDIRKALVFDNQYEALEAIRKCCFEGLFVIKL